MLSIHRRIDYILKHNVALQYLYRKSFSIVVRSMRLFVKRDKKMILFSSYAGRRYNDSPKVLFEAMLNDPRFKGFTLVWAFEHPEEFPIEGCEKVTIDTVSYFRTALKAGIWITSLNIERGLSFKPKGSIYVDTWHGAGTKKIGNAIGTRHDYDLSTVDMMLVQSHFEKEIFIRDFNCREEAIRIIGFPRNDELFHVTHAQRQSLRQQMGIPDGKKVILYAPTWRDSKDGGVSYVVEPPINMDKWRQQLSSDYVILFRMHVLTTRFDMTYDDFARDATAIENLNHVLAVTDIMITDYSTIVYDAAVARIPFICFGFDYERYSQERGFYYDLNSVYPGGVMHTEDDVLARIRQIEQGADKELYENFRTRYIEAGGNATQSVLDEVLVRAGYV